VKLVSSSNWSAPTPSRLYFVHIPKTAGVTLKAFLENNIPHDQALVVDEWDARRLTPGELGRYTLFSGHYASEVLEALPDPPNLMLTLVREPVSRFRSWWAHCRRLTGNHRYRDLLIGRSPDEVLASSDAGPCTQAHWLARALERGAAYEGVPTHTEVVGLLDRVQLVGVTDEIDRFMQLVSFRLGWPAPTLGWRINTRPDRGSSSTDADGDGDVKSALTVDTALYEAATLRFWQAYAEMLSAITPESRPISATSAPLVSLETAQEWLRRHHQQRPALKAPDAVQVSCDADAPVTGEGWWWRERPYDRSYRWTGPGRTATMRLPPLQPDRSYELTMELMGAADWPTWDGLALEINGQRVSMTRERSGPRTPNAPNLRLQAMLPPDLVARQDRHTHIAITVPETRQALQQSMRVESFDTVNPDMRLVGVAVSGIEIREATTLAAQRLTLRRAAPERRSEPTTARPRLTSAA
jgi:hypothetical protein